MKIEYSGKERKLLNHFGIEDALLDVIPIPSNVYRIAVFEAFIRTESGCYVNTLRRILRESKVGIGDIYRMTPEFDALIQLEDE